MRVPNRILVPVDFSDCSRAAVEYAATLAKRLGAEVDVMHVLETPHYVASQVMVHLSLDEFERSQAGTAMKELLSTLEERGLLRVRGRLESGEACSSILQVAEKEPYDLIVMGTHGRTGLSHLLMGSVAEKVVRQARCPVLTVRSPPAAEARSEAVADGPRSSARAPSAPTPTQPIGGQP